MPKLYFRYGTMNSSKSANLIMTVYNYRSLNRHVIVIKPAIDNRAGKYNITSRAFEHKLLADIVIDQNESLDECFNIVDGGLKDWNNKRVDCIISDESQFLTCSVINKLRELSQYVPVICYGLRTDYLSNLFKGSKRLMEIADSIEEIKTICSYCDKKAIVTAKIVNGNIQHQSDGKIIDIGAEEKYRALCWKCYMY